MQIKQGSHEPAQRRRFSRWAALHAWKLAGLTALVTFIGVFIAVSLSLLLRPTRSYFFPLLSDVTKHQPEAAILRIAFAASTALFFATTTASLQHCRALQLFSQHYPSHTHPVDHVHMSDDDLSPIVTKATAPRRRFSAFLPLPALLILLVCAVLVYAVLQHLGISSFPRLVIRRPQLLKLGTYVLCLAWSIAMGFLIWYFLKLQHMPDRIHPDLPLQLGEGTESSTPRASDAAPPQMFARIVQRVKLWASRLIVILRPICLTGQAVCVIKIVGLWFALDSFSISKIKLVKIALLAALAFAEYTAAFFFAFFMTILAVDMRSKASTPDLLLYA